MDNELDLNPNPELEDESTEPGTAVSLGLSSTPVDDQSAPLEDSEEGETYIQLNRSNLYKEIARLEREDPDFAAALNTQAGRRAKLTWEPQVTELRVANEALQRELRTFQIMQMQPEEVERRFQSDPQFAREYAEAVHADPNQVADTIQMLRAKSDVEQVLYFGEQQGLSDETLAGIRQSIVEGYYDRDEQGQPIGYAKSLQLIQQDVTYELLNGGRSSTPNASPAPVTTNPKLSGAGPDMSMPGGRTSGTKEYPHIDKLTAMSPDDFEKIFPTDEDYQRAVDSGLIPGVTKKPALNRG